jgi:hypothetical protein
VLLLVEAALWSVALGVVVLALGVVLEAPAFWSAVVLLGVVVLEAELWSVVVVELVVLLDAGGFTGALALSACVELGLVVVAAGALLVLLAEAALWSVDAVPVAGGFTGALALSPWPGAWVVFVVAAGAFALLVSLVGALLLPGAAGVVLLVEVEEALWSAVVLLALAPIDPEPVEAWLLVHESEIMFTELTCREPSLPRVPCTCTWCPSCGFSRELSPCRLMVWPLLAESTQFPPDCFRQPLSEPDWSLPFALVAVEFCPFVSVLTFAPFAAPGWSVVLPWLPGVVAP